MAVLPVESADLDGLAGPGGPAFPSLGEAAGVASTPGSGEGFLGSLTAALERLAALDREASAQAQALAAGRADDLTSVVMAVERASLALQLAVQVRDRAVEAYHDLFRMQI